jgi:hypothetical protein
MGRSYRRLRDQIPFSGVSRIGEAREYLPRRIAATTLGGDLQMVRWNVTLKIVLALGACASLLVTSGAGLRWGDISALLHAVF